VNRFDPTRWPEVETHFDRLCDASPDERRTSLAALRARDAELAHQVEGLLEATETTARALEANAPGLAADLVADEAEEPATEAGRIGRWRLGERLGAGGMGVVHRVERADAAFEQTGAMKLLRWTGDDPVLLERFRQERRILASLEHPNVARLLDGGIAPDGRPFLVMEYVEGRPITDHCRDEELSAPACLDLVRAVCDAVDAAHRRLVVHRDLKPANILVTDDGTVKLLDFGVAKLLDDAVEVNSELTMAGGSPLTPSYAAPEQKQAAPVTTASDVYALGVLIHELVTGTVPSRGDGSVASISGDLALVVARCLHEDPERRYASAHELSEDLRRALQGRPVEAGPDSAIYRFRRLVSRNRATAAASALALLTLFGGLAATTVQSRIAAHERDLARAEARRAQSVTEFLAEIFHSSDPLRADASNPTARALLARGVERIETELADAPALRADILSAISHSYFNLGQIEQALDTAEAALAIREADPTTDPLDLARALFDVVSPLSTRGSVERADSLATRSLALRRAHLEAPHEEIAQSVSALGGVRHDQGRIDEAHALYREALDMRRTLWGEAHEKVALSWNNLASTLGRLGRHEEAERAQQRADEIWVDLFGPRYPSRVQVLNNLALSASIRHDLPAAETYLREAIGLAEELGLGEGAAAANARNSLGKVLIDRGAYDQALGVLRRSLRDNVETTGPSSLQTGAAHLTLGQALVGRGDVTAGLDHLRRGHGAFELSLGPDHPFTAAAVGLVGWGELRGGSLDSAAVRLEASIRGQRAGLPATTRRLGRTLTDAAELRIRMGDHAAADRYLSEADSLLRARDEELASWERARIHSLRAECFLELGRDPHRALGWAESAVEVLERVRVPGDDLLRAAKARAERARARSR